MIAQSMLLMPERALIISMAASLTQFWMVALEFLM